MLATENRRKQLIITVPCLLLARYLATTHEISLAWHVSQAIIGLFTVWEMVNQEEGVSNELCHPGKMGLVSECLI